MKYNGKNDFLIIAEKTSHSPLSKTDEIECDKIFIFEVYVKISSVRILLKLYQCS